MKKMIMVGLVSIISVGISTADITNDMAAAQNIYKDNIDVSSLTTEEYKVILQDAIKVIPAIEENSVFLGRLKSELSKIQ